MAFQAEIYYTEMSQKNTCVNAKRLAIEQLILQLVGVLQ